MPSPRHVGRAVGLLSLLRALGTPVMYFVLLPPATGSTWLTDAAPHATQVRGGMLLGFALAALALAVPLVALPILRRYSERLAFAFLAASVLACVTIVVENVTLAGVLAVSQERTTSGTADALLPVAGHVVRAAWRWSHFTNLLVGGCAGLVFALALYRARLVPRLLAGAALLAGVAGIPGLVMSLLGRPFDLAALAPLGIVQLALILWLVVRGFDERAHDDTPAAARG